MSGQSRDSLIVRFYDPQTRAKDVLGRTQEQILSWPDTELEMSHNYIQMLFPLPEGSAFNFAAPVIDLKTMEAFRARAELRAQLRESLRRLLHFYGFSLESSASNSPTSAFANQGTAQLAAESASKSDTNETTQSSTPPWKVVRNANFRTAARNWAGPFNHNHLRITRILRCLRVLGLQAECEAFYGALVEAYNDPMTRIGSQSIMYWRRAVERPLYIAPDDEEVDWLEAWEAQ